MEEPPFLVPVRRTVGGVEINRDLGRWRLMRLNTVLDQFLAATIVEGDGSRCSGHLFGSNDITSSAAFNAPSWIERSWSVVETLAYSITVIGRPCAIWV